MLLTACPRAPLSFGAHGRVTDPQVILDDVRVRRAAVTQVQGEAKAAITSPEGSGKLTQYLVAQAPDHIRLESISFFGDPLAVLTSNGTQFAMHDLKQNRFYEGAATATNVSRLLPMRLPPDELVSLVLGVPPLVPDAKIAYFTLNAPERVYELVLTAHDQTEVLSVETATLRPVRVDMLERPLGLTAYRAEFGDYAGTPDLPREARLIGADGKTRVELRWRQREVNGALDADVFTQDVPENATRIEL
jgi:outer membrane lipoprotein-sorting protein